MVQPFTAARNFLITILSTTGLCRILWAAILLGYCLSYIDAIQNAFAITPRYLLPPHFWVWTIFTYWFLESRILLVIFDVICSHLCSKLIEPLWGPLEVTKYLGIVTVTVAFASTLFFVLAYAIASDVELLFSISIHGFTGNCGALIVAVKQILPDDVILTTPIGRVKNANLPLLILTCLSISSLFGWLNAAYLFMYSLGCYSGWIYLRFFQHHSSGSYGDQSEHFSFSSFFPRVTQPFFSLVGSFFYHPLVKIGVCRRHNQRRVTATVLPLASIPMPSPASQEMERRRQKALRDLNERLNRAKEHQLPAWPSLEDQPGSSSPPLPDSAASTSMMAMITENLVDQKPDSGENVNV